MSRADATLSINFTETVKVPLELSVSFQLPPNSNDASVIAAVLKEATSAAFDAIMIATAGVAPSNITAAPFLSTNADGTLAVIMRIFATFAASVNTTALVRADVHAVDPVSASASAVKAASNGAAVAEAAAGLVKAAKRAAAVADSFANGTLQTGVPPASLASRLASAASAALIAAGKSSAFVNRSSITPSIVANVGAATVDITNQVQASAGNAVSGIAASESAKALQTDGFFSGAAFGLTTIAAIVYYFRSTAAAAVNKNAALPDEKVNPLYKRTRPLPPSTKPPKHAYMSFYK